MGRKIVVTATVRITVDETVWANEYGMEVSAVVGDIPEHVGATVDDVVRRAGIGYLFEQVVVGRPRVRVEA